jgi:lysophospholipase L1-like esterase
MPNPSAARTIVCVLILAALPTLAAAQSPQQHDPNASRYMALGDSIPAGYKAAPVTQAYPYLLVEAGVFDRMTRTLFCNAAVPGSASQDVLLHQVALALIPPAEGGFQADNITLSVGGNDLLKILHFAAVNPDQAVVYAYGQQVIGEFGQNLYATLAQLRAGLPQAKIFVSNQYTVPDIEAVVPAAAPLIAAFNTVVAQVTGLFATHVFLVDVYSAFAGRNSVLLIERHGADMFEVHPTLLGHRVIAQAFADVINQHK